MFTVYFIISVKNASKFIFREFSINFHKYVVDTPSSISANISNRRVLMKWREAIERAFMAALKNFKTTCDCSWEVSWSGSNKPHKWSQIFNEWGFRALKLSSFRYLRFWSSWILKIYGIFKKISSKH